MDLLGWVQPVDLSAYRRGTAGVFDTGTAALKRWGQPTKGLPMSDPTPDSPQPPTTPPTTPPTQPPAPPAAPATPPPAAYPPAQPPYGAAPAYGAQPPYGAAQPYGAPAYTPYPAPTKTNALAIVSLISSIVGLVLIPFLGSLAGVITGHISLKQLKTSGENGRGMALAGTIVGWVGLAFAIIGGVLLVIWFVWIFSMAGTYGYDEYSYSS